MADKKFQFIKDLNESRLLRHKKMLSKYNAKDLSEMIFLYILALQILKSDFHSAPFGLAYLNKSFITHNINEFRPSSTDLNLMVHSLFGRNNDEALALLSDADSNEIFLKKVNFDINMTKRWVRNSIQGNDTKNLDYRYLLKSEQDLQISNGDYKSIRRLVSEWNDLSGESQQLAMTRLIFAFRRKMPQAEIMKVLEKFARAKKLLIKGAHNPETNQKEPTLASTLVGVAAGAAAGIGISRFLRGNKFTYHKTKKNLRLGETSSVGATSSGNIAPIGTVLGDVVSRNPVKKSSKPNTKKSNNTK